YAKARYITVIPEIELPGHSSAALAAYLELGCKADYKYKVQTTWGIFKEVYCPTEKTFQFLEDVFTEVIGLFPDSPYLHIGGIETAHAHHDVIMTPGEFAYFDHGQGDPAYEPINIGGYLPLDKVYAFDPVPKELGPAEAKYVIGGQANMWTEYLPTPESVE